MSDLDKAVDLTNANKAIAATGFAKYKGIILQWLRSTAKKLVKFFTNPNNLKKPKVWILAIIFLRCLYLFMNEYGLNPFKKNITGDHVYLTGAGGGIGRLMALRFGKLGCKLSLSDINEGAINETKTYLVERGVPAENIFVFKSDVSRFESIKEGAQLARNAFGDV